MADKDDRSGVLGAIRNPLIFFALALLVIEGIFGLVVANSSMTGDQQFIAFVIMAVLFILVIGIVALITIRWPKHLYEDIAQQLETSEYVASFIDSDGFRDAVTDIVSGIVSPDALIEPTPEIAPPLDGEDDDELRGT